MGRKDIPAPWAGTKSRWNTLAEQKDSWRDLLRRSDPWELSTWIAVLGTCQARPSIRLKCYKPGHFFLFAKPRELGVWTMCEDHYLDCIPPERGLQSVVFDPILSPQLVGGGPARYSQNKDLAYLTEQVELGADGAVGVFRPGGWRTGRGIVGRSGGHFPGKPAVGIPLVGLMFLAVGLTDASGIGGLLFGLDPSLMGCRLLMGTVQFGAFDLGQRGTSRSGGHVS